MIKPFDYHTNVFGGTEYMGKGFESKILSSMPKLNNYLSIIIPGIVPKEKDILNYNKDIILWMHNLPKQFNYNYLFHNIEIFKKIKYIIVLSEEHKRILLLDKKVNPDIVYVIPNAIDEIIPQKKSNKIKIIHTSAASRGMNILINSLKYLNDDFIVEIYNDFYPDLNTDIIFDSRIKFFGKTPKLTVKDSLASAHIHAYPSIYFETFCLSQAEAMSAGLLCVTSDFGALPEISNNHTILYRHTYNYEEHSKIFAKNLKIAIDKVKSNSWNPKNQIEYINSTYSWDNIKNKWLEFHKII